MLSHPLPIFLESACSPVTVGHVMKIAVDSKMSEKAVAADMKLQQAKVVYILTAHQTGCLIEERVMSHKSSSLPPSFTSKGQMHLDTKSEILECIAPTEIQTCVKPETTAAILEGSVIVRQVRP